MGWQEGINLGLRAYENGLQQAQLARENKWKDELQARQRLAWEDEDLQRRGAADVRSRLNSDLDGFGQDVDPTQVLGIQPPRAPAAPRMVDTSNLVGVQSASAPPQEAPAAPVGIKRGQYSMDQIAGLRDQLALAGNNPQQLAEIRKQLAKTRLDSDSAAIQNYVLNADPAHLDEIAKQVTADKRNTFEIKPQLVNGKATGLYTVGEGKTSVDMSRAQLAQWMAANHRLKNGDASAMADLQAIDKDLAAKVQQTYDRAKDAAGLAKENYGAQSQRISAGAAATGAAAAMKNANTMESYRRSQESVITDERDRRSQLAGIQEQIGALDPSDKNYARNLQQLVAKFNVLNVKNGGQLTMPRDPSASGRGSSILNQPVSIMKNDDGTHTAYAKDGGRALYNTYNGETLPLGMEISQYKKLKAEADAAKVEMQIGENNGVLEYRYKGPSGEYLPTVKEAAMSKPPKATAQPSAAQPMPQPAGMVAPSQQGGLRVPAPNVTQPTPVMVRGRPSPTGAYEWLGVRYPDQQSALAAYYGKTANTGQ